MKVLESSPHRYDKGIRILTLGKIDEVYDRLVEPIEKDSKVLDIGCGTGLLSIRAALKGARVTGIDINPQMLQIAEKRAKENQCGETLNFMEMGVAELDSFLDNSFDFIISGLCFSELSSDELSYTLKQCNRLLTDSGFLIVADEAKPKNILKKLLNFFIRLPLTIITYVITQTTTRALSNLDKKVVEFGFKIIKAKWSSLENFLELTLSKEKEEKR